MVLLSEAGYTTRRLTAWYCPPDEVWYEEHEVQITPGKCILYYCVSSILEAQEHDVYD